MLSKEGLSRYSKMYFRVIITTAELHVCKLDPANISMKTGEIKEGKFISVPFVRFRKSLSNFPFWKNKAFVSDVQKFRRIEEIAAAKERTVWVINAAHLIDALEKWDFRFPVDY
jgi:hypothetical protein